MAPLGKGAAVTGLLTFGTMTSLFSKVVYELKGVGLDGEEKLFRKPWFMTTLMFLGMSCCLPLAWLQERAARKKAEDESGEPLLPNGSQAVFDGNGAEEGDGVAKGVRSELRDAAMLAIPTAFDLAATALMNVGLLSVTASVYQMMRGAEMIFAAVLAVLFLRRHLNSAHYGGIACCAVGIALVGAASVLSGEGGTKVAVSSAQILFGMALIVASQLVQAAQVTFEDYFMSEMSIAPMKIVGYEGVIGSAIMLLVMLPAVSWAPGEDGGGVHEDSRDTLHMIASAPRLAAVLTAQCVGLLGYNYAGMNVTGLLGAVFRTVLETMRTLFVWLLGLALFYAQTGLGESWTAWSPVQALGFCILVMGTMVYGRGDERAAQLVVAELMAEQDAGLSITDPMYHSTSRPLPAPHPVPPTSALSISGSFGRPRTMPMPVGGSAGSPGVAAAGVPPGSAGRPIMVLPSPSWRASHGMAAGSYHEALASSLRSHGFMGGGNEASQG